MTEFNLKLQEAQNTLSTMIKLIRLNRDDINRWTKEIEKKEQDKKDIIKYKKEFIRLNKEKIKNDMRLMDINNDNNDLDDKLDYVKDIIGEHNKKKNKEIHLELLQEYLSI